MNHLSLLEKTKNLPADARLVEEAAALEYVALFSEILSWNLGLL